jgi:hypothetical protein
MAQRRAKGGGVFNRREEEERGTCSVGRLACWAGSGKMGRMTNGPMKKKNNIQNLKLIARFRKLITENLVAEITGKNSQKIVGN